VARFEIRLDDAMTTTGRKAVAAGGKRGGNIGRDAERPDADAVGVIVRVLRRIRVGGGDRVEGRDGVGHAAPLETLGQQLRVTGAPCLIRETPARVAGTP